MGEGDEVAPVVGVWSVESESVDVVDVGALRSAAALADWVALEVGAAEFAPAFILEVSGGARLASPDGLVLVAP